MDMPDVLHYKVSGELLGDAGALWTPDKLRSVAEGIGEVYGQRKELNLGGIMIVPGAGNIVRGGAHKEAFADTEVVDVLDAAGRAGTYINAIGLTAMLRTLDVDAVTVAGPNMGFTDPSIGGPLPSYSVELANECYAEGIVVVNAGGTGKNKQSTDTAVNEMAENQARHYGDTTTAIVFKGTSHNGVFDDDPATNRDAAQYSIISAQDMLADYERFKVVDKGCLQIMVGTAIEMTIYSGKQYTPLEVLQARRRGSIIGTLVVGHPTPPRMVVRDAVLA